MNVLLDVLVHGNDISSVAYTIGSIESILKGKWYTFFTPKSEIQFYFENWIFIEFLMTKKLLKIQNLSQLSSKNHEITFIKPYLFIESFPTIWRKHLSVPKMSSFDFIEFSMKKIVQYSTTLAPYVQTLWNHIGAPSGWCTSGCWLTLVHSHMSPEKKRGNI
jgi:hypothetical protein